jgi:predicted nucleic acid-binding protein
VNLVVDTNIVFSTLLNPHSAIGEILMNVQDNFVFFAPELLKEELQRYLPKIAAYTKLSQEDLINIRSIILSNINFVSEELISENSWVNAFELTKDIDEDDTPFIVLAIELNTKLWTGDKVLLKGLIKKQANVIITSAELKKQDR